MDFPEGNGLIEEPAIMHFAKLQGLGNDFIVTHDALNGNATALETIRRKAPFLCDRRFGIGADGVLCVLPSAHAAFMMRVFNADGSEAEMCGNGIRCFAVYLEKTGLSAAATLAIETQRGIITASRQGRDVRVDMGTPILSAPPPPQVPTAQASGRVVMHPVIVDGKEYRVTCVSMGNPHAVVYANELTDDLVLGIGQKLESHPFFPKKTNVEFIQVLSDREIRMRVFERGCGETMACGTGACASVVSGIINGRHGKAVTVHMRGGDLFVEWEGNEADPVHMTGPATWVYSGEIAL
jgi:diaminopimelate epimerase